MKIDLNLCLNLPLDEIKYMNDKAESMLMDLEHYVEYLIKKESDLFIIKLLEETAMEDYVDMIDFSYYDRLEYV